MIGLSTQQLLRRRMDVTANNLANINTTGFKVESIVSRPLVEKPAKAEDRPNPITFVEGWTLNRDMSTGPLQNTGNPLDVAINGEGFFSIGGGEEPFYTRDGNFSIDADGRLINRAGQPVLGEGAAAAGDGLFVEGAGGEIRVDPELGDVSIAPNGAVMQDNQEVARLRIVRFDTPAALEKRGGNLYAATDEQPQDIDAPSIQQGFLEGSNVKPVLELTRMIEISRAYQSVSKMINDENKMREQAIGKLARVR